jgi:NAD-dependent dihydropyrimidine dehydrogenase PreA subunit
MIYLKDVVTLHLEPEKCTGCRMCINVCPHEVFELRDRKAMIADRDRCMECGACVRNCPAGAIRVNAGVGCAAAVINGMLKGTEPECGCSCEKSGC